MSISNTSRVCPICDSNKKRICGTIRSSDIVRINATYNVESLELLNTDRDKEWPIVSCYECGMMFAEMLPSATFLSILYDSVIDRDKAALFSLSPSWISFQLGIATKVLNTLAWDPKHPEIHCLLDFGCGYGTLVESLKSDYLRCIGFETSVNRLTRHQTRGLETFGDWRDIQLRGPYSAILCCEVLEHVPNPKDLLLQLRSVLRPNGIVAITVPCFTRKRVEENLRRANKSEQFTQELNPWEHLNYFSPQNLRRLVRKCGFTEIEQSVDIGIRPALRGLKRTGNCAKSFFRLIRYSILGIPTNTHVIARVKE